MSIKSMDFVSKDWQLTVNKNTVTECLEIAQTMLKNLPILDSDITFQVTNVDGSKFGLAIGHLNEVLKEEIFSLYAQANYEILD